jgi:hypothetical protein
MIRPRFRVTITQSPDVYPSRTTTFILDFITEFEVNSSWKNLTDTAKLKFPKNVILKTADGGIYDLSGKGRNIIAGDNPPFIMRGDRITIESVYWYYDETGTETRPDFTQLFSGFITKVSPSIPVEIECEDNMYKLKQVLAPNKAFTGTVEDMVTELIKPAGFTLVQHPQGITTNVGVFRTQNETVAQVLDRLRRDYRMESWFRGDKLHCSAVVYFPNEIANPPAVFEFNSTKANIISDSLEYTRKDDVILGALCYSVEKHEIGSNKDGSKRSKRQRLSITVGKSGGEMKTLYFWNVKSVKELKKLGEDRLSKCYFEGYHGSFTTFGEPYVKHGDQIILRDPKLPEREGTYFVKSVRRSFSVSGGYRQEIGIDIRADVLSQSEIDAGV